MSCPPGELLSALVDGALGHDERDRVHAHLAGCAECRAEVEGHRALKSRLSGLAAATPPPPPGLVAALQALAVPSAASLGSPPRREDAVRPVGVTRPPRRVRHRRLRRSSAVLGVVAVGTVAALLAGGGERPGTTPVDPGSDAFVVDFASTTGEVPLSEPPPAVLRVTPAGAAR